MKTTKEQALEALEEAIRQLDKGDVYDTEHARGLIAKAAVYLHQSQPVPEGYVLVPANLTTDMVRAFALETVGRWDSTTEAEKQEVAEKLQIAFDAMLAAAPKPGADND